MKLDPVRSGQFAEVSPQTNSCMPTTNSSTSASHIPIPNLNRVRPCCQHMMACLNAAASATSRRICSTRPSYKSGSQHRTLRHPPHLLRRCTQGALAGCLVLERLIATYLVAKPLRHRLKLFSFLLLLHLTTPQRRHPTSTNSFIDCFPANLRCFWTDSIHLLLL
jgi:hypothetical protein